MWGWVASTIVALCIIEWFISLFDDIGSDVVIFENDEELQTMMWGGLRKVGNNYRD